MFRFALIAAFIITSPGTGLPFAVAGDISLSDDFDPYATGYGTSMSGYSSFRYGTNMSGYSSLLEKLRDWQPPADRGGQSSRP